MNFHEELVQSVKLFELGDPSFILAIVRYLTPRMYMPGDFVTRQGEMATDMYFILQGNCEVLATDGVTKIAYMGSGDYLGEIGILLKDRRSVSVRTVDMVNISSIDKKDLMPILDRFPDYSLFLHRVAEQRLETSDPMDIDVRDEIYMKTSESEEEDEDGSPSDRLSLNMLKFRNTLSSTDSPQEILSTIRNGWCVPGSKIC